MVTDVHYRPNLWILIFVLIIIVLILVGLVSGYLAAWWGDALSTTYPSFAFKRANKVLKVLQFAFGFFAVFELVAFPKFFRDAKNTFVWAGGFLRFSRGLSSRALRITRNSLAEYLEDESEHKDLPSVLAHEIAEELHREMDAVDRSIVAKGLNRLSTLKITPNHIKAVTFGGFFLLTAADIFTS